MNKVASLCAEGFNNNILFDERSLANRDNCFAPFVELHKRFLNQNITLNTEDMNIKDTPLFELHMNIRPQFKKNIPTYLLLSETSLICPLNGRKELWPNYRKIFTWDDTMKEDQTFIRLYYANPITLPTVDGFSNRNRFCCLIAGNKTTAVDDARELYSERVRAIRWFEKNAPLDFDLFGTNWNAPVAQRGLVHRILGRALRAIPQQWVMYKPFPSYRGKVANKSDVYKNTRYSICFENVRDIPGYITEKIFDCFFSGCVPVYRGANNIADHIPTDCFIDYRNFNGMKEVYAFLKSITEADYIRYQQRIKSFLESDQAKPFSADRFADIVSRTILTDLNIPV